MLEKMRIKANEYKTNIGGNIPIFTPDEILNFINHISDNYYDLKDDSNPPISNPSGDELREFLLSMQK